MPIYWNTQNKLVLKLTNPFSFKNISVPCLEFVNGILCDQFEIYKQSDATSATHENIP